jgi:hypothetical protein
MIKEHFPQDPPIPLTSTLFPAPPHIMKQKVIEPKENYYICNYLKSNN